jgi:hypothetical protein
MLVRELSFYNEKNINFSKNFKFTFLLEGMPDYIVCIGISKVIFDLSGIIPNYKNITFERHVQLAG